MLTNQMLQSAADALKSVARKDMSVIDRSGKLCATTEAEFDKAQLKFAKEMLASPAEHMSVQGRQYFRVAHRGATEYVLVVGQDSEDAFVQGRLAALHIQALVAAHKGERDRESFMQSLLLESLLPVDINVRAQRLGIDTDARRVAYIVRTDPASFMDALEIMHGMFPDAGKDFVASVEEGSIVLVKELEEPAGTGEIGRVALTVSDTLLAEAMGRVWLSIGSPCDALRGVPASYGDARLAMEIGMVFEQGKKIVDFAKLGIGRLIHHLPKHLARAYMDEVFRDFPGFSLADIDDEMHCTINKFFECDLSVSVTARELYIHRNTLIYRLDKLQKNSGLDLRKFSDAIAFKIALMAGRHLLHGESGSGKPRKRGHMERQHDS